MPCYRQRCYHRARWQPRGGSRSNGTYCFLTRHGAHLNAVSLTDDRPPTPDPKKGTPKRAKANLHPKDHKNVREHKKLEKTHRKLLCEHTRQKYIEQYQNILTHQPFLKLYPTNPPPWFTGVTPISRVTTTPIRRASCPASRAPRTWPCSSRSLTKTVPPATGYPGPTLTLAIPRSGSSSSTRATSPRTAWPKVAQGELTHFRSFSWGTGRAHRNGKISREGVESALAVGWSREKCVKA